MFTNKLGRVKPTHGHALFRHVRSRKNTLVDRLYPNAVPRTHEFLLHGHVVTTLSSALIITRTELHSNTLGATN